MPNEIEKHLEDFLAKLQKDRNSSTAINYRFYLKRFFNHLKIKNPSQINAASVARFKTDFSLMHKKGKSLKNSTLNYHLIALRSFIKYLKGKNFAVIDPQTIVLTPTARRKTFFLQGSDLEQLLEAPLKSNGNKTVRARDKAILEIFFLTGIKVSEMAALKTSDVDTAISSLTTKKRTLSLTNQANHWLAQYLKLGKETGPLFRRHDKAKKSRPAKTDAGLTPRSIQRLVKKYVRITGLNSKISPQTLRHTFAREQLKKGTDIKEIQTMLNHSSIISTRNYRKCLQTD